MRFGDGQLYTWTDGLKRKDWHDYERIQKDAMRLGEMLKELDHTYKQLGMGKGKK